jgi:RNA-directed DNA polymerase
MNSGGDRMSMAANNTMSTIASGRVLDEAYAWLRSRRLDRSANNDFWALSLHWPTVRGELRQTLLAGDYLLSPLQMIELADGSAVSQWSAQDAIALKALAIVLTPLLKRRLNLKAATHLKNNGGLKAAVNTAAARCRRYFPRYICKR